MMLQNLHTHTTFGDGSSSAEEMVQGAIRSGCGSLGFSEHSPLTPFYDPDGYSMASENVDSYCREVLRLREKYARQIKIFLGLEQDYDSPAPTEPLDYLIGSVHDVVADGQCLSVDNTRDLLIYAATRHFGGDFYTLADAYYRRVGDVADRTGCQIVGHFDLVTKFNEGDCLFSTSASRYVDAAMDALDRLLKRDVIFEINTGAISRNYRTVPYPAPFLLKAIRERGGRVCISSDSHNAQTITNAFPLAAELALSCGFQELWVLTETGFQSAGLTEFLEEAKRRL